MSTVVTASRNQQLGDDMTEYLTTHEVAELLRTPTETIRYWRRR